MAALPAPPLGAMRLASLLAPPPRHPVPLWRHPQCPVSLRLGQQLLGSLQGAQALGSLQALQALGSLSELQDLDNLYQQVWYFGTHASC